MYLMEMYGLSAVNTASRTSTPTVSTASRTSTPTVSATQRLEASAPSNPSTQTASARLQNAAACDKKSQQQKKSAKAVQRDTNGDSLKTQRQANEMSSESSAMRPDRDFSATVSKQRNDFSVDVRTPSQPPQPQLPPTDVRQPSSEFVGRLAESSSLCHDQQLSSHVRAEEFLQVSNLLFITLVTTFL